MGAIESVQVGGGSVPSRSQGQVVGSAPTPGRQKQPRKKGKTFPIFTFYKIGHHTLTVWKKLVDLLLPTASSVEFEARWQWAFAQAGKA